MKSRFGFFFWSSTLPLGENICAFSCEMFSFFSTAPFLSVASLLWCRLAWCLFVHVQHICLCDYSQSHLKLFQPFLLQLPGFENKIVATPATAVQQEERVGPLFTQKKTHLSVVDVHWMANKRHCS